jgi:L-aspartate oxidase
MAITCDFLVIGSGVAGLSFALEAASFGDVVIVTKRSRDESNTRYAQGGIAAVLGAGDSFDAHINDTLVAGAGLCHERAVEICVKDGPERVAMLQRLGARFDRTERKDGAPPASPRPGRPKASEDPDLDLHLEGGHSARRIVHASDMA